MHMSRYNLQLVFAILSAYLLYLGGCISLQPAACGKGGKPENLLKTPDFAQIQVADIYPFILYNTDH